MRWREQKRVLKLFDNVGKNVVWALHCRDAKDREIAFRKATGYLRRSFELVNKLRTQYPER